MQEPKAPPGLADRLMACAFCERVQRRDVEDRYILHAVARFEPLNPVTPGHMLFIPGWHAQHPNAKAVSAAMLCAEEYAAKRGEDFNLITSSGAAATQTMAHIHVHYVPRREGDGLRLPWSR